MVALLPSFIRLQDSKTAPWLLLFPWARRLLRRILLEERVHALRAVALLSAALPAQRQLVLAYCDHHVSGHLVADHVGFAAALPSPNSPFADARGDLQVRPGDRIGGIPADRFKAGAEVTATGALTLGADVLMVGPQWLIGDEANLDARLPGYWTADVHAALKLTGAVELYGRVDNLFGRRYATYGTYFETDGLEALAPSPLPDAPDPRSLTPAAPRSFLVGIRARW